MIRVIALLPLLVRGGPGYSTAKLAGTVTIDGTPIAAGTITFTPLEGNRGLGQPAEIKAGRYEASNVPQGKVRVDFHATRETGKMVDFFGKPTPEVENLIPAHYRTGLPLEVTGDNPQQDFKLTTKP